MLSRTARNRRARPRLTPSKTWSRAVSARSSAGKSGRPPSTPSRSERQSTRLRCGSETPALPSPEPFRAPIREATWRIEAPRLPAALFHVIGVEAEIVYRFARDLPPRATPYARDEVLAAVGSMHPAVEIVDTRFSAFGSVDALNQRADQQNHGALSVGPALQNWSPVDPVRQPVRLTIGGTVRFEGIGENSAVDPVRLLVWMANHGTHALGGLRAGQVVTTGSCTGTIFVESGTHIAAAFPGLGAIEIEIS